MPKTENLQEQLEMQKEAELETLSQSHEAQINAARMELQRAVEISRQKVDACLTGGIDTLVVSCLTELMSLWVGFYFMFGMACVQICVSYNV